MTSIFIPTKHQSAPRGSRPAAPQSQLRELHNRVVGVHNVNGVAQQNLNVLTENFDMGLSQELLDEARATRAGKFLLELLGAVDYAGQQRRPVMLMGRKVANGGGMRVKIVVPIDTRLKPGPSPQMTSGKHGVTRVG